MKKNKFKIFSLLFISALSLTSCSSSDSEPVDIIGTTTGDYFPMAVNNKWNYTDGASTTTYAKLLSTQDFNGITYYNLEDTSSELNIPVWMTKKGASYYQKSTTASFVQNGSNITMEGYELKILRDDIAVGESWSGKASPKVTYSGSNGSGSYRAKVTYEGSILATGETEIIQGNTYNNIIKVYLIAYVNSKGIINQITTEYWFAKDVGIVRELETSTVDNQSKIRYLTSYELH